MAENNKDWLDDQIYKVDSKYPTYETRITLLFAVALTLFSVFFSLLATVGETVMTPLYVIGMAVSFWVMVICGFFIIRNAGKTETNIRLKNIEEKLEKLDKLDKLDTLISSVNDLINEIKRDRDERNNKGKSETTKL